MKDRITFIAKSALACAVVALASQQAIFAGPAQDTSKAVEALADNPVTKTHAISQEIDSHVSYVAPGRIGYRGKGGDIDEIAADFKYIVQPQLTDSLFLRTGVAWERYSFGLPEGLPLPNTLQSVNAIIGLDGGFSENFLFRIEAAPGLYSDFNDISGDDFNVPFQFGFSYLVNPKLQWFLGARVDLWSSFPVAPGAGVRWQFADRWTLNFVLPRPRLEYDVNDKLQLYVGGDFKGGTYRVRQDIGNSYDKGELNNAILEYREIRTGAGLVWKITPSMKLEAEGGCMVDREFDYHRTNVKINSDPAAYAQLGFNAEF